jgi:predicted membrane-bound mannosyltransferase
VYAPRESIPSTDTYYRSCSQYEPFIGIEGAPTLGEALSNPLLVPRLVWHTVGSTGELYACQWITPRADDPNPYVEYLGELATITGEASTAIIALAVVGFAATVYRSGLPDDLVSFSFYWGAASVVGYPIVTDIGGAAWLAVHVVLPLSIPAAVGAGVLYDVGRDAWLDEDTVSTALSVAIALVLVGSMLWTGYATSVSSPTSEQNPLVQYAQPDSDLRTTLVDLRTLADQDEGTDVVLVGENLSNPTGGDELEHRPTCADWFEILPLPWYFEAGDMEVDCAPGGTGLNESLAEEPPVVVVTDDEEHLVAGRLADDYERRTHRMRTTDTWYVYYVDESRLD